MKAKDIVVGQDYAVGSYASCYQPRRATVLEVGDIPHEVRHDDGASMVRGMRHSHTSTSTAPCVRVQIKYGTDGPACGPVEIVPLNQVLQLWAEWEADQREAEDSREARIAETRDLLERLQRYSGVRIHWRDTDGTHFTLYPSSLRELVDAFEKLGAS